MDYNLRCIECGREYETDVLYTCECGGLLEAAIDLNSVEVDFKLDGRDLSVVNGFLWSKPMRHIAL